LQVFNSISTAHRVTGKSRTTIAAHMKSGKLSYTEDDNGNKVIDASELIRVYGDSCNFDQEHTTNAIPAKGQDTQTAQMQPKRIELDYLKQQLENERKERERERSFLVDQIENLQDSLKTSQEGHNRATLLLENQNSGAGDWKKSLKAMEARIANQEKTGRTYKEERQKILRQNQSLKRALEQEKSKGFWQKLFG